MYDTIGDDDDERKEGDDDESPFNAEQPIVMKHDL